MGWGNDGAIIGRGKQMISLSGEVFTGTDGQWLKRRIAAGNWATVQVAAGPVRNAFCTKEPWNGYIWAWSNNNTLYRSPDGINWTADIDVNAVWGTQSLGARSSGGSDGYLYISHCDAAGVVIRFARRDKLGNWTNNVLPTSPLDAIALCHTNWATDDIVDYGGYVYWAQEINHLRRCIPGGAAWEDVHPEPGWRIHQLMIHDGFLLALGTDVHANLVIWRRTAHSWVCEARLPVFAGATGNIGYISRGDDGELYTGTGVTDGIIWKRVGVSWIPISIDTTGAGGASNAIVHGGDFFHSENIGWPAAPQMRLFAPVYTVSASGLYPQAMDIDADGNAIYIGLIDGPTTFPVLLTTAVPIDTAGMAAEVFTPGAGTAINVKCNDVGRNLVVAGAFGLHEQVETSDDGGVTWTDIDPGNWGLEVAQPLLVDPDTTDGVMVALGSVVPTQDIVETVDGGTTWTVRNAAVGYAVAAMARLPVDSDELVVGDAHAARKVEYSPNRGEELVDITGGAAIGNVVALEVV